MRHKVYHDPKDGILTVYPKVHDTQGIRPQCVWSTRTFGPHNITATRAALLIRQEGYVFVHQEK